MGKFISVLFIISIIIFTSGCIEGLNFGEIKPKENVEKATADILVIQDIHTIPSSPIPAGSGPQEFELLFTIKNLDEQKTVKNIRVELFDYSVFKSENYEPDQCSRSSSCLLLPLGQKVITFSLKTPTASEIGHVKVTPKVSFKVNYDFDGTTTYDVVVINMEEIKKLQTAGKTPDLISNKIIGSGPIKVDAELMGDDKLILAGKTGRIKFVVKNEGSGDLVGNNVEVGGLKITFPSGMTPEECPEGFNCVSESTNTNKIQIYQKESSPLIFKIENIGDVPPIYKTFNVRTDVEYTYELRGSLDITVEPIE